MSHARRLFVVLFSGLGLAAACLGTARAQEARPGVVSHVKVLSDKVPDVSSLEAWKKSWIKPGMSNDDKALAIWKSVVLYRHQCAPPIEFLQNESNVHDVVKTMNVYGYGMCCCASANTEQLARAIGWDARGWAITLHSVPEVFYDNAWHLLDGSLMNFFRHPDGSIAGVADIARAVMDWHDQNPGYRNNGGKLIQFAKGEGWKRGPALLTTSETYTKDGFNAAWVHGWHSTMIEYDAGVSKHHPYEYGYSQGYQVNIQLRPGERLTRNWFNKGLHINMDGGDSPGGILKGRGELSLQRKLGDIAPGRIGNGLLEYDVPLADGTFRTGALAAENLAAKSEDGKGPAVHVKDAANPGILILRMPSSYVYLTGQAAFQAIVGDGGQLTVSFSDNNGLDWKEIAKVTDTGFQKLDLKPHCYRRYDYRIRFELKGAGTGLDNLKLTHDIQHCQTPLPALTQGENKITFTAGPQEGTLTVEASTNPDHKGKQLVVTDFHPELKGINPSLLRVKEYNPEGGEITFPIETPGDIVRLRGGAHFRARDAREGWLFRASFDDGKTFQEIGKMMGPKAGSCSYFTLDGVPPKSRKALVQFKSTQQRNTLCIFDFRIDADYKEPNGGFAPVQITYVWDEGGAEKRDVRVARQPTEHYTIPITRQPLMKSIILELAE